MIVLDPFYRSMCMAGLEALCLSIMHDDDAFKKPAFIYSGIPHARGCTRGADQVAPRTMRLPTVFIVLPTSSVARLRLALSAASAAGTWPRAEQSFACPPCILHS